MFHPEKTVIPFTLSQAGVKPTTWKKNHFLGPRTRLRTKQSPSRLQNRTLLRLGGFLKDYCINTTLHGLRYIAEDGRHWSERLLWVGLCTLAVIGASFLCLEVATRYRNSPTMTVVEGTNYHIANIPFPSVIICDHNKVPWSRALRFQEQEFPGISNESLEAYRLFVGALSSLQFGDFDKIPPELVNNPERLEDIKHLNISKFMMEIMPSCQEFFVGQCWWRNDVVNCCDIFEVQRTESGFCYSFNSETAEERKRGSASELRPRRTSTYGEWSGLRVTVNPNTDPPPGIRHRLGISLEVSNPYSFPGGGMFLAAGQHAEVEVAAQVTYTTKNVRRLPPASRRCLYWKEQDALGYGRYFYSNCIVQCQLKHAVKYCNCIPYFYPRMKNVKYCDIMGLLCLNKYNSVFNYMKPPPGNPYFDDSIPGMVCDCLPDCDRQDFSKEVFVSASKRCNEDNTTVFLDVHFDQQLVVRYRTDIVFDWLDLIVAFGGIAGLFLGCSMLSGAELLYYITQRLWFSLRRRPNLHQPQPAKKNEVLPSPCSLIYID